MRFHYPTLIAVSLAGSMLVATTVKAQVVGQDLPLLPLTEKAGLAEKLGLNPWKKIRKAREAAQAKAYRREMDKLMGVLGNTRGCIAGDHFNVFTPLPDGTNQTEEVVTCQDGQWVSTPVTAEQPAEPAPAAPEAAPAPEKTPTPQ